MIVVSDTSPINYLALIDQADRLFDLYRRVIVPRAVYDELQATQTPAGVRAWIARRPAWLEVHSTVGPTDPTLEYLGAGEREAIALAIQLRADALLMDDRDGRMEARQRGLPVIGTLGVLAAAAESNLLDFSDALRSLQQTTFRASPRLVKLLLEKHRKVP